MSDTRPNNTDDLNNADDLKAAMKATWASITPEQCHRLIASIPRRIDDQEIKAWDISLYV